MLGMPAAHAARKGHTLTRWQLRITVATVVLLAVALLAAAAASSYDNLWHLAVSRHVPVARLNPLELDGGLVVITLIDIVFTWIGYPLAGLRFAARVLGIGTVAANVAAGWPDPVGGFLRAFAPAIIVAIAEAVRSFLLRRQDDDGARRGIPAARWMLAPWPTFVLWRRMKLWHIPDYRAAVDMELSRRQAVMKLGMRFGDRWETAAPADLVWMLRTGVRMGEALARVSELTAPGPERAPAVPPGPVPGTVLEPVPQEAPERAPDRARDRAPKVALKLTAAKSRSMPPEQVAEHVSAMLGEHGDVSLNRVKSDLSVGTEKARVALEIARRNRTVVPMEARRA